MDRKQEFLNDIGYLKKLPYQIANEIESKFDELKLSFSAHIQSVITKTINRE